MNDKLQISRTDADFDQFNVFIHGMLQTNVVSANAETGEVVRYLTDEDGKLLPKQPIFEDQPRKRMVPLRRQKMGESGKPVTEPKSPGSTKQVPVIEEIQVEEPYFEKVQIGEEPDHPTELATGLVTIVRK